MTDNEAIYKMLDKANIEFEENEGETTTIVTEHGIEFVFGKKGALKSVNQVAATESNGREGMSWKYMDEEEDDNE